MMEAGTCGGIGQAGALAVIESDFEPPEYVPELQQRRDTVSEQLGDIGVLTIPSKGGVHRKDSKHNCHDRTEIAEKT